MDPLLCWWVITRLGLIPWVISNTNPSAASYVDWGCVSVSLRDREGVPCGREASLHRQWKLWLAHAGLSLSLSLSHYGSWGSPLLLHGRLSCGRKIQSSLCQYYPSSKSNNIDQCVANTRRHFRPLTQRGSGVGVPLGTV